MFNIRGHFLNSKEVKELKKKFLEQFGYEDDFSNYAFSITDKNKIYMVNRDVDKISLDDLRLQIVGLYFCEDYGTELRLSIEGSQIVGPKATKNVIELDKKQSRDWLKGFDLEFEGTNKQFVIVKCGDEYLGCGKIKENKLLNFVPKERRIRASD